MSNSKGSIKSKVFLLGSIVFGMLASCSYYLSTRTESWRAGARQGLQPVSVPINCTYNSATTASFQVEYSENHYVGLNFSPSDSLKDLDTLIGETLDHALGKLHRPSFDIAWSLHEGDSEIASGSGKRPFGSYGGRGIMIGEFPIQTGRVYHLELKPGRDFIKFRPANPRLEVFVAPAAVSVANELWYSVLNACLIVAVWLLATIGVALAFLAAFTYLLKRKHSSPNRRLPT